MKTCLLLRSVWCGHGVWRMSESVHQGCLHQGWASSSSGVHAEVRLILRLLSSAGGIRDLQILHRLEQLQDLVNILILFVSS